MAECNEFISPVKINSGNKALEHIPCELDALDARKPLVIAERGAAAKYRIDVLIEAFKDSGITIGIFDEVPPLPSLLLIKELFGIYRDRGFDAIIAMGGGSAADTAKVLNIAVSGRPEDIDRCVGEDLIEKHLKPLIIVPGLSGTGYEMSRYAFFDSRSYASPFLVPHLAVIDPRTAIPEDVLTTSASTLLGLTHAVEAYISYGKNLLARAYAYAAIQLTIENLVKVIANPEDSKGCVALANAQALAGCTFSNVKAGIAHGLGNAVAKEMGLPPGVCMGVLLPYILEKRMSECSHDLGELFLPLAGFDTYAETANELRPKRAVDIIHDLIGDLARATGGSVPQSLKDAQVPRQVLPEIARRADYVGLDMEGAVSVLEGAWRGR
ncbi:MAG TPA: iron-containing alcohol dehydrogenase [Syntrophales bacterium]|nr:iron-containing alcohol dehydrogenase [Syntrophales bacterium]